MTVSFHDVVLFNCYLFFSHLRKIVSSLLEVFCVVNAALR